MDSFLVRFKNSLVLVTLLLAQTVGLAVQVRRPAEPDAPDGPRVSLARAWVVAAVTPFERLVHGTSQMIRSTWSNYVDLRDTRRQNAALRHQLDRMQLEQAAIAEDALQGHRLQTLLGFQQSYVSGTIAAQVIGTGGTDLSRVLYVDKGSTDGIRSDMAVITPDGIVGKVREIFPGSAPHVAQILLINDQTSGAGVLLAQTRVRAVVHGTTAGLLQIGNLTPDDRIKPGEAVLTSGGDQVFPRGLPVGTIEAIAPDPDHQPYTAIRVRPAANLTRLEEVLIITGTQPALAPATLAALTKGAAATAEARAAAAKAAAERAAAEELARQEAARSAAEVVSDRLPSLHDPADAKSADPAAAAANVNTASPGPTPVSPKSAGGVVPRPLPAIRADHYSPGTTPSAGELIPGAQHAQTLPDQPADATPPVTAPRRPRPSSQAAQTPTPARQHPQ